MEKKDEIVGPALHANFYIIFFVIRPDSAYCPDLAFLGVMGISVGEWGH
jgi:hypothetical protein